MKGFGFSLKWVLFVVAATAVGVYALVNASSLWVTVLNSITAILLLTALIAVAYRTGPRRAFWVGFSVFCWGQLLLRSEWLEQRFPTLTAVADEKLCDLVRREVAVPADVVKASLYPDGYYLVRQEANSDKVEYFQICHSRWISRASAIAYGVGCWVWWAGCWLDTST